MAVFGPVGPSAKTWVLGQNPYNQSAQAPGRVSKIAELVRAGSLSDDSRHVLKPPGGTAARPERSAERVMSVELDGPMILGASHTSTQAKTQCPLQ
jgi:hypothetical protein